MASSSSLPIPFSSPMEVPDTPSTRLANKERFETELEFVQCLANPNYLESLALKGYFDNPSFLSYLDYLLYWTTPDFSQYIQYPLCLPLLRLIAPKTTPNPAFRQALKDQERVRELRDRIWAGWGAGGEVVHVPAVSAEDGAAGPGGGERQ
ncbi:SOH1-domain-containing protein [Atractiella rhizophila]|nr:SOH1-domain-containing protein [Atractiella rhizophila]